MDQEQPDRETFVYDTSAKFLVEILSRDPGTIRLLCPVCKAELIFAPTWERARELSVHPGAYCPNDKRHLIAMYELKPPEKSGY